MRPDNENFYITQNINNIYETGRSSSNFGTFSLNLIWKNGGWSHSRESVRNVCVSYVVSVGMVCVLLKSRSISQKVQGKHSAQSIHCTEKEATGTHGHLHSCEEVGYKAPDQQVGGLLLKSV